MPATDDNRKFSVTSPLGKDALLFRRLWGTEQLSQCYEYKLELFSERQSIAPKDLLGKFVDLEATFEDGKSRHFGGTVVEFIQIANVGKYACYHLTLRPWLWLLTRRSDCRIFQNKTTRQIITDVFRELGFTDLKDQLQGTYVAREYCVQYREGDFDFVSRLMEEEGIYYFFSVQNGKQLLHLVDSSSAHSADSGYATIPFWPPGNVGQRKRDHIYDWSQTRIIQSGKYTLDDFDFEKPNAELRVELEQSTEGTHTNFEQYDYPGRYTAVDHGKELLRTRLESLQAEYQQFTGEGNVFGLTCGSVFTLENHDQTVFNKEYLVAGLKVQLQSNQFTSVGGASDDLPEFVQVSAILKQRPFRAPQRTRKPVVRGPQTAIVVGKSGEEIWTDKYGRVKVQFHWDRLGKKDENSSCWVRVSQPWAGKGWGAVAIPRIGQEVIVDFLEGDPDRPVIVGRLYNAEQIVPYALPDNATQTGIKSRSSKGGTAENFNEIRLEDKKGSEEIYVHAEKNLNVVVENNETRKVGFDKKDAGDQTVDIYNHRTTTLEKGNDKLQIKEGNRTILIDKGSLSLTITKGDRTAALDTGHDTLTLKQGNRTATLDTGNDSLTLKNGNRNATLNVGSDALILKSGNRDVTLDAGNDTLILKAGNQTTKLNAGASKLEAMQSIELKVGGSSIKIDQTGVTIKGMMIKIDGQVQTEIKGVMTTVQGAAMLTAKGGIVMIN